MKYLLPILLLFSCSKQVQEEKRSGGLLPNSKEWEAKVPLIVSKGFIADNEPEINMQFIARGKQDKQAPRVEFISPLNDSTVSGEETISVYVKDNISVASVSFSINGLVVLNVGNPDGLIIRYNWNTANELPGFYQLTATAQDAAGNIRSVSITVLIKTIVIEPDPPAETGVSLTMPPVMNQGSEGSCVATAIGYAARGAEWFYKTGTMIPFSVEFMYNQIKFSADCNSGTAMQTGLDLLVNKGICTNASMEYSSTNGCSLLPNEAQLQEALQYKIESYYKIYCTDHAAIKSMIDQKRPVIINVIADNSFIAAKTGFVWRTYSGSGSLPHCIVICGYDDSKNAYKIMNSWGAGWCDTGFGWIDYDFFLTRTGTWCYAIK